MKILCLHGYTQNAGVFKKKIAVLSKALQPDFETIFVDGPIKSTMSFKETQQDNELAWWNSIKKGELHHYIGYKQSLDYLHEFIRNQGPFHGILGFSQGATMACILASTMNPPPSFLIVCGGFIPRDPELFSYLTIDKLKSLHIMGERDELVSVEQSMLMVHKITGTKGMELEQDMISPITESSSILLHDGGHVFPCKSIYKKLILEWIHGKQ